MTVSGRSKKFRKSVSVVFSLFFHHSNFFNSRLELVFSLNLIYTFGTRSWKKKKLKMLKKKVFSNIFRFSESTNLCFYCYKLLFQISFLCRSTILSRRLADGERDTREFGFYLDLSKHFVGIFNAMTTLR